MSGLFATFDQSLIIEILNVDYLSKFDAKVGIMKKRRRRVRRGRQIGRLERR